MSRRSASVLLAEERLVVLLSSHSQSVFSTFPALPTNKIKLKAVMDVRAVKIFVWLIKFCFFVLLPFKHLVKALGKC